MLNRRKISLLSLFVLAVGPTAQAADCTSAAQGVFEYIVEDVTLDFEAAVAALEGAVVAGRWDLLSSRSAAGRER